MNHNEKPKTLTLHIDLTQPRINATDREHDTMGAEFTDLLVRLTHLKTASREDALSVAFSMVGQLMRRAFGDVELSEQEKLLQLHVQNLIFGLRKLEEMDKSGFQGKAILRMGIDEKDNQTKILGFRQVEEAKILKPTFDPHKN